MTTEVSTTRSSTKAERVRQAVLADIVSGALPAGAPLDEVVLAGQHAVSRTPVREALRRLQSDGLLEPGPRRQLLVVDVSPARRREVTTLRVALEGAAAVHACTTRDDDDLDRLELLVLKQRRAADAGDAETFLRLDEEFHLALAGAARMPTLSRMLAQLGAFVRLGRLGEVTTATHLRGLVREHEELLALLRSRAADDLRARLATHIEQTAPRT
ncbi:GntR family transcriptional regulator [Knoellia aerolata]|uniref:Transcriptional regulator n=1 Tax=Knoellia aerolata DSM 18566 TaxID=1385519 RepID=A0A0A0JUA6_9MICO|nr:GntR family transcriptional regulator [Knoellia aerolata]KGN40294.1 transcriptional regulator [Knoellia aerolata DSM 18566]